MPRDHGPSRRNRSAVGNWVPLIATVAVATVGFAAWAWNERQRDNDGDKDDDQHEAHDRRQYDEHQARPPAPAYDPVGDATERGIDEPPASYVARMSGALRRTPSPQQFIHGASRTFSAGITAAGAAFGNALSSIREEDRNAYKDHETWSEEAEAREVEGSPAVAPTQPAIKLTDRARPAGSGRKTKVAVVVSADADLDGVDDGLDYSQTHASILSFLSADIDFSSIQLFVLIFSPDLKRHPLDTSANKSGQLTPDTPDEDSDKAQLGETSPHTPAFNELWSEAEDLVEKKTMIFPFTTQTGHLHILRHLAPDCIYLQEALSGKEGDAIAHIQTWLRGDVVVVVGGDHVDGGLADSESEADQAASRSEKWWEKEERVGRGRHVFVVENIRVGDDWARRIEGKD